MKHKRRRAIIRQLHKRYHKAMRDALVYEDYDVIDLYIELLHKVGQVRR